MTYLANLTEFIQTRIGEERWAVLCEAVETDAIMLAKGLVTGQSVDDDLAPRIAHLLNAMQDVELQAFEHLLVCDQNVKGVILDAIAAAKKARGIQ